MITCLYEHEENRSVLQARNDIYLFLAKVFLGEFSELAHAAQSVPIVLEGGDTDLALLIRHLKKTPLKELKLQYDNLLVVPGPYFVPPFEHYYRPAMTAEEVEQRIRHHYCESGYHFPVERLERHDHIGCELAFMHFLITGELHFLRQKQYAQAEQVRGIQRRFLSEHLLQWVALFEKRMSQTIVRGFMRDATSYMCRFIERDVDGM